MFTCRRKDGLVIRLHFHGTETFGSGKWIKFIYFFNKKDYNALINDHVAYMF